MVELLCAFFGCLGNEILNDVVEPPRSAVRMPAIKIEPNRTVVRLPGVKIVPPSAAGATQLDPLFSADFWTRGWGAKYCGSASTARWNRNEREEAEHHLRYLAVHSEHAAVRLRAGKLIAEITGTGTIDPEAGEVARAGFAFLESKLDQPLVGHVLSQGFTGYRASADRASGLGWLLLKRDETDKKSKFTFNMTLEYDLQQGSVIGYTVERSRAVDDNRSKLFSPVYQTHPSTSRNVSR